MPIASILAMIVAVSVITGFGGGYAIANWRKGAEIEKVRGENTVLTNANNHCAADIVSAKAAMTDIIAQVAERERQAAEAMNKAQPEVEKHQAKIIKIKAMQAIPLDQQCEAIKQEQIAYVKARRSE